MISRATGDFWKMYGGIPQRAQRRAKAAYERFQRDPYHPGLQFKQVHSSKPIYSVRISDDYRAVGVKEQNEVIWFWIGTHADYDNLLRRLY